MNYRTYGEEPYRLVVVHAGPGFQGSAVRLAKELSKRYGVVEAIQTKHSIKELIEELREIIAKETKGEIILIGHGWGAWLCTMFAAQYPKRVKKIVLIGTLPLSMQYTQEIELFREEHFCPEDFIKYRQIKKELNSKDSIHNTEALMELGRLCKISDEFQPYVAENDWSGMIRVDVEQYRMVCEEITELRRNNEILKYFTKVQCPMCIMHGKYDVHPYLGVVEPLLRNDIPHSLSIIDNCGHTPWCEKLAHDDFFQAIYYEIEMIREEKESDGSSSKFRS